MVGGGAKLLIMFFTLQPISRNMQYTVYLICTTHCEQIQSNSNALAESLLLVALQSAGSRLAERLSNNRLQQKICSVPIKQMPTFFFFFFLAG